MILKFSNQDIPSDILTSSQFKDAFSRPQLIASQLPLSS